MLSRRKEKIRRKNKKAYIKKWKNISRILYKKNTLWGMFVCLYTFAREMIHKNKQSIINEIVLTEKPIQRTDTEAAAPKYEKKKKKRNKTKFHLSWRTGIQKKKTVCFLSGYKFLPRSFLNAVVLLFVFENPLFRLLPCAQHTSHTHHVTTCRCLAIVFFSLFFHLVEHQTYFTHFFAFLSPNICICACVVYFFRLSHWLCSNAFFFFNANGFALLRVWNIVRSTINCWLL